MNTILKNRTYGQEMPDGKTEYLIGASKLIVCRPETAIRFARRFGLVPISPIEYSRRYV